MISALAENIVDPYMHLFPRNVGMRLRQSLGSLTLAVSYIYYGVVPYIYKWLVCANLLNRALESIVIECT